MIHVCFGLHDKIGRYSKFVGTTMASIFENTSAPVTVHILHDATLTNDNRDKFSYMAGNYGQRVKFHDVEKICPAEIKFLKDKIETVMRSRFSVGTFYRLLLKKILAPHGVGKVIYLDADIIVNLDIEELWRHDLTNFPLAAVPEAAATLGYMIVNKFLIKNDVVNMQNYFNAGVIVFNLNKFGEKFFREGLEYLAEHPQCECFDQDILNAFFAENYLKLDQKFDSFVQSDRLRKLSVEKKIYHYAGQCIELKLNEPFNKLFMDHFTRTPWFDVEAFARIGDGFRKSNDDYIVQVQWMLKVALEHRRFFCIHPNNLEVTKSLLSIGDDEPILEFRGKNSFGEMVAKMRELRGQKVFFLCLGNYLEFKRQLYGLGFREFADFVNGLSFMTSAQCGYLRPEWDLIRDM